MVSSIDSSILLSKAHVVLKLNIGLRILDVYIDKEQIGIKLSDSAVCGSGKHIG